MNNEKVKITGIGLNGLVVLPVPGHQQQCYCKLPSPARWRNRRTDVLPLTADYGSGTINGEPKTVLKKQ